MAGMGRLYAPLPSGRRGRRGLPTKSCIIDGELIAAGRHGQPDFLALLQWAAGADVRLLLRFRAADVPSRGRESPHAGARSNGSPSCSGHGDNLQSEYEPKQRAAGLLLWSSSIPFAISSSAVQLRVSQIADA